jgi:peptidoglycan/xylan/chitin deacetylase (PgdA/CDA1 family)
MVATGTGDGGEMSQDRALVLMYHRISSPRRDPFWLCASPENFQEQLAALGEIAEVVPLRSIFEKGRRVAITFDDGYRDSLEAAYPLLRDAQMPATVFVASDVLSMDAPFWWDRLEQLILDEAPTRDVIDLDTSMCTARLELQDQAGRERALAAVQAQLRHLPSRALNRAVDEIAASLGKSSDSLSGPPVLDVQGLRELARDGSIEIGGHGRTHSMLSGLTAAEQQREISGGKRLLEEVLGRPVTTFAYPFGDRRAFSSSTVRLVRKAGYELACTTRPGRVTRTTRKLRIPRLAVRNWGREEFISEVTRALDGG